MRRYIAVPIGLAMLACVPRGRTSAPAPGCAHPAPLTGRPLPDEPDRVIVTLDSAVDVVAESVRLAHRHGLRLGHVIPVAHVFGAWVRPAQLAALRCEPAVRAIEYETTQPYY